MDSGRLSSDYGEEIMPTLDRAGFKTLTPREQESYTKVYEVARRGFLARHFRDGQGGANNGEHANDDLNKEEISEIEAKAIIEHYYGASDDQTKITRRQPVSVEGPYFGQEDSDSSMGFYSGIGLGGDEDEEVETSPVHEPEATPPSPLPRHRRRSPPLPPPPPLPKTISSEGKVKIWLKGLSGLKRKDRYRFAVSTSPHPDT